MIKKIVKNIIFLQLILVSVEVFAISATPHHLFINATNINVNHDIYPALIGTFKAESNNILEMNGSYNGSRIYEITTAYVYSENFPSTQDNNKAIFKIDDYFGFTMTVKPNYTVNNKIETLKERSFSPGSRYAYFGNLETGEGKENFKAQYIGASISIDIYALKKPELGTNSIKESTIAHMYARGGVSGSETSSGQADIIIKGLEISSYPKTCNITSSEPHTINMESAYIGQFSTRNEVSARGASTSIDLNCFGGVTTIKAGMSDITSPNNTSSELTLAPNSTATGISIRLYHDGTNLINYNPDTTTNTWTLTPINSINDRVTIYKVPITATYYKNKNSISSGTVFAKAKITFIYN